MSDEAKPDAQRHDCESYEGAARVSRFEEQCAGDLFQALKSRRQGLSARGRGADRRHRDIMRCRLHNA